MPSLNCNIGNIGVPTIVHWINYKMFSFENL